MPIMFRDWLPSYRDTSGIAAVLHRISHFRVKRANRLGEGAEALRKHYGELQGDFRKFFPELVVFSEVRRARFPQNLALVKEGRQQELPLSPRNL
jgi:acyl carrier protein phosphodiesterase